MEKTEKVGAMAQWMLVKAVGAFHLKSSKII